MDGFGADEKRRKGKGVIQTGSPQKREREKEGNRKYREGEISSREGVGVCGRRPCFPKPLNITVIHDIYHHGYTILSYYNIPLPPFTVY